MVTIGYEFYFITNTLSFWIALSFWTSTRALMDDFINNGCVSGDADFKMAIRRLYIASNSILIFINIS